VLRFRLATCAEKLQPLWIVNGNGPLLNIRNLKVEFGTPEEPLRAVNDVSLKIDEGQTVCLVGESGSGKSVTALSVGRLIATPPARYAGQVLLRGRDVLRMSKSELREIRGGVVSYIFQEPGSSLNPVFRVGNQILEALKLHRRNVANEAEVIRLLKLVGIPAPESRLRDYPHQLSGGMQQRVMIAMALASQPTLLIADEPTTALDVTVQAQIIELLARLQAELGMSLLLITHNLGIIGDIADRVGVMYAGQIVEWASAGTLLAQPLHPYTQALLNSVPRLRADRPRLTAIPGGVPSLDAFPSGCRFHPRCPKARFDCPQKPPELLQVQPDHWVRCFYWNAPLPNPEQALNPKHPAIIQARESARS
jgi:oligopeptide/dipeptide ABC transporter ATP-binding protein